MAEKRNRYLRRVAKVVGVVVIVLLVLGVAAKYWIVPAVLRWQIGQAIAKRWNGALTIDAVEFNYFGPVRMRGLRLAGPRDRTYLTVKDLEVGLAGFPGLSPKLAVLRIDQVQWTQHAGPLPLRTPPEEPPFDWQKYVDLQDVKIGPVAVAVVDAEGNRTAYEPLHIRGTREGEYLKLDVEWWKKTGEKEWTCEGRIHAKEYVLDNFPLAARRVVEKAQTRPLLAALGAPLDWIEGELAVNLTASGPLLEPDKLKASGTVALRNLTAGRGDETPIQNVNVELAVSATASIEAELKRLTGTVCGGTLRRGDGKTRAHLVLGREMSVPYELDMYLDGVDAAALRRLLGKRVPVELGGNATAHVRGSGTIPGGADSTLRVTFRGRGLRARLDGPVRSVQTDAEAELTLAGPLDEPAKLRPTGTVTLTGLTADSEKDTIARNVTAKVVISSEASIQAELKELSGTVFGGTLRLGEGPAWLRIHPDGEAPPQYQGRVALTDLSVPMLGRTFGEKDPVKTGTATVDVTASGRGWDVSGLHVEGTASGRNLHTVNIPVLNRLLAAFNKEFPFDVTRLARGADVDAAFVLADNVVTPTRTEARHTIFRIVVEEGGTINLVDGRLNLYVVGAPPALFEQLRLPVGPLPDLLSGLIGQIGKQFVRLRVGGTLDKPTVAPAAFEDVEAGLLDVLRQIGQRKNRGGDSGRQRPPAQPNGEAPKPDGAGQEDQKGDTKDQPPRTILDDLFGRGSGAPPQVPEPEE